MSDGKLRRLRYYKGQMLTAQDFKDQQAYHNERLTSFQKLFSYGIVGGLDVKYEGQKITVSEGLAIDRTGLQLRIGKEGLEIPKDEVKISSGGQVYLSIVYDEECECASHSVCETKAKHNRIVETVDIRWDDLPNNERPEDKKERITLALIKSDPDTGDLKVHECEEDDLGRVIRINARVVDTNTISDGAVTAPKIDAGAVGSVHLIDKSVDTQHLVDRSVTKEKLADSSIVLADGSVTTPKLADDAVIAGKIADNAVEFQHIVSDAVRSQHIQADAVGSTEIANNAVQAQHILNGTVGTAEIANNAVRSQHILNGEVGTSKIVDGAVDSTKIADNAVQAQHIVNGTVGSTEIATDGVRSQHIQDGAVGSSEIASDAVQGRHILDGTVGASLIASDAVQGRHILNGTVTSSELAKNAVLSEHIQDNTVTASKLAADAVGSKHILAGAVTSEKVTLFAFVNDDIRLPVGAKTRSGFSFPEANLNKPRWTEVQLLTQEGDISWQARVLPSSEKGFIDHTVEVHNAGEVDVTVRIQIWGFQ